MNNLNFVGFLYCGEGGISRTRYADLAEPCPYQSMEVMIESMIAVNVAIPLCA